MNKQEIEQEIKNIEDYKKIAKAKGFATFLDKYLAELQVQLAEAEKPALRHGDYGYNDCNEPTLAGNDDAGPFCFGPKCNTYKSKYPPIINPIGNIFDDLAAEPLEEFEMDVHKYRINKGSGWSHAPIHIAGNNHTLSELHDFILNLKRMEAYYIKKAVKE